MYYLSWEMKDVYSVSLLKSPLKNFENVIVG